MLIKMINWFVYIIPKKKPLRMYYRFKQLIIERQKHSQNINHFIIDPFYCKENQTKRKLK